MQELERAGSAGKEVGRGVCVAVEVSLAGEVGAAAVGEAEHQQDDRVLGEHQLEAGECDDAPGEADAEGRGVPDNEPVQRQQTVFQPEREGATPGELQPTAGLGPVDGTFVSIEGE